MAGRYNIPNTRFFRVEDTIKRSLFLATFSHTSSVESAREFIAQIKAEHPDATHNCWAYQAGPPGSTALVGLSDDGEPHGTAGKPMLNMLMHADIGELSCVVTRYFGGTKLGTGGLVRAYGGMVKLGLETLPVCEHITPVTLEVVIDYSKVTLFKRMLPEFEIRVLEERFTADAGFLLELPDEHQEAFTAALTEMTNGESLIDVVASTLPE